MKIGFTGTRNGMTEYQKEEFVKLIKSLDITEFHHGDCIGADMEAHDLVVIHKNNIKMFSHPSNLKFLRAYCESFIEKEKPLLERNKDIVNETELLIACPDTYFETYFEYKRSGTWSTIRYAKNQKKKYVIIFPDGNILQNEWVKEGIK